VKCVEVELLGQVAALKKQLGECVNKNKHWEQELSKVRGAAEEDDDYDLSDDEGDDDEKVGEEPVVEAGVEGDDDEEMEDVGRPQKAAENPPSKAALPILSADALDKYDKNQIKENIGILESERSTIAKNANMGAIAEYRKKEEDYLSRYAHCMSLAYHSRR
jgi:structural maintenance of chromosome 4